MTALKTYGLLVPFMLLFDLLWLGLIMKDFYANEIGELMRRSGTALAPRWGAALLVYLLIPAGLILFVRPLIGANSTSGMVFLKGATFGLVLYGVYDLTNLAILEKWTMLVTIVDIVWGGAICGISSVAMQWIDHCWKD